MTQIIDCPPPRNSKITATQKESGATVKLATAGLAALALTGGLLASSASNTTINRLVAAGLQGASAEFDVAKQGFGSYQPDGRKSSDVV